MEAKPSSISLSISIIDSKSKEIGWVICYNETPILVSAFFTFKDEPFNRVLNLLGIPFAGALFVCSPITNNLVASISSLHGIM